MFADGTWAKVKTQDTLNKFFPKMFFVILGRSYRREIWSSVNFFWYVGFDMILNKRNQMSKLWPARDWVASLLHKEGKWRGVVHFYADEQYRHRLAEHITPPLHSENSVRVQYSQGTFHIQSTGLDKWIWLNISLQTNFISDFWLRC